MSQETYTSAQQHRAVLALLVGTVLWGCAFTWAKEGGQAVNHAAGLADGAPLGPVFFLAIRFFIAGVLWFAAFPASRRGWSIRSLGRATLLGGLLGLGLIVQHLGLDRTSEAVSAFLTSLTILFVPLLLTLALRRPPAPVVWVGVLMAMAGVWMMTGPTPTGFGVGEVLGLGCSVIFSFYIIGVNRLLPADSAWRMTGGQFMVVAMITGATCLFLPGMPAPLPSNLIQLIATPQAWVSMLLLIALPTLTAFGLMMKYQPRVDPTRAAMVYLMEPVFAAAYAYFAAGRTLGAIGLAGAGLILVANGFAELWENRDRTDAQAEPTA
jgi:drug/metabolite transporter (DMT)-like permease